MPTTAPVPLTVTSLTASQRRSHRPGAAASGPGHPAAGPGRGTAEHTWSKRPEVTA
jgi:hypothetical protein